MTFAEYQRGVNRSWRSDMPNLSKWQMEVLFAETGLSGETGEISEMVKKGIFHGIPEQLDPEKMKKELGDALYYITKLADLFGWTVEEVAHANNVKLAARYPEGFKEGGGIREGEGA